MRNWRKKRAGFLLCFLVLFLWGCNGLSAETGQKTGLEKRQETEEPLYYEDFPGYFADHIPVFSGSPYITVNDNRPMFSEVCTQSYELYSELDGLGRCGTATACLGVDLMPTEEREAIGMIKPSGWQVAKYDFVDGNYLFNRCHLIGYQLAGENKNEKNLITGTRYLNVEGMLPFENQVADFLRETKNHVMYRVTPVYKGEEILARGVLMEGYSVEDEGEGICFCVYVYNCQPGVEIDYATGKSHRAETDQTENPQKSYESDEYVLNNHTMKFHKNTCSSVDAIKEENKEYSGRNREDLAADGYSPCKKCNP